MLEFLRNLAKVLASYLPLPRRWAGLRATWPQLLLALLFFWLAVAITNWSYVEKIGGINVYGLSWLFSASFCTLAGAALAASLSGRAASARAVAIVLFITAGLVTLWTCAVWTFQEELWQRIPRYGILAAEAALIFVATCRTIPGTGWRQLWRKAVAGAIATGVAAAQMFYLPSDLVFYPPYEETAGVNEDEAPAVDVEALYLAQGPLLQGQVDALLPGTPGRPDLFAITLGGTAHQGVFLREVDAVNTLLSEDFGARGRILSLANSRRQPMRYPLANRVNLEAALGAIAAHANPTEDLTLLFMTSHGGEDVFSLSFWEAGTHDVTAAELANMLDRSGLRNVIIVLSACHAGSFIDELARDDRLIVTAAAADKRSFGCSDQADWTWWGRAYFDEALRQTRDFRTAFDLAQAQIGEWEAAEDYAPSEPQISIGADIGPKIDAWLERLDLRPERKADTAASDDRG
ncbi:MAG: C13 family peptidase [Paracoccaceae bacterium]